MQRPYRITRSRFGGNVIAVCDHCSSVCAYWDDSDLDEHGRLLHRCEGGT